LKAVSNLLAKWASRMGCQV